MEYTKFNALGQWELCKTKVDKPYEVYGGKSVTGELHEDHGQKGTLHNFSGGKRPKPAGIWNKRHIKQPIAHPEHSVVSEREPGLGNEEVE
jgi:hypothetical protein